MERFKGDVAGPQNSESKLERHLQNARVACARNATEVAGGYRGVRVVQQSVIETVEKFSAELQFPALADHEKALDGEVQVESARSAENIASRVAEGADSGGLERLDGEPSRNML